MNHLAPALAITFPRSSKPPGRGTGKLTQTPLPQANADAMIQRRAAGAVIAAKIGNHTFLATGITAHLKNGGALEKAAAIANHSSTRTI